MQHDIRVLFGRHLPGKVAGNGHFTKAQRQRQRCFSDVVELHQAIDILHRDDLLRFAVLLIHFLYVVVHQARDSHFAAAFVAESRRDLKGILLFPDGLVDFDFLQGVARFSAAFCAEVLSFAHSVLSFFCAHLFEVVSQWMALLVE